MYRVPLVSHRLISIIKLFHSSAVDSTALIEGKRFCEECIPERYTNKLLEFQQSDATYKCRAESCGADKLSPQEFLIGTCCEAAMTKIHSVLGNILNPENFQLILHLVENKLEDEHQMISKIHHQIRDQIASEGEKMEDADKELSDLEAKVREAKEALKKAKENAKIADEKLEALDSNRQALRGLLQKSEKRVLIVTKAAFKDHGNIILFGLIYFI